MKNIIIADYDVNTEDLRKKLKLNSEDILTDIGYALINDITNQTENLKFVLITRETGLLQRHIDLFDRYKNYINWFICFIGEKDYTVEDSAKERLERYIFRYKIAFVEVNNYDELNEYLQKGLSNKRRCLIVSDNNSYLIGLSYIFNEDFSDKWEFTTSSEPKQEDYEKAELTIVAGKEPDDFAVAAPQNNIRKFVFIEKEKSDYNNFAISDDNQKIKKVSECLNNKRWNIRLVNNKNTFVSFIETEKYYNKYRKEQNAGFLQQDKDFVMWDEYGLPYLFCEYNEETVRKFFERNTNYDKIRKIIEGENK